GRRPMANMEGEVLEKALSDDQAQKAGAELKKLVDQFTAGQPPPDYATAEREFRAAATQAGFPAEEIDKLAKSAFGGGNEPQGATVTSLVEGAAELAKRARFVKLKELGLPETATDEAMETRAKQIAEATRKAIMAKTNSAPGLDETQAAL